MIAGERDVLIQMRATERVGDGFGNMVPAGEVFLAPARRAMVIIAGGWGDLLPDDPDTQAAVLAFADDHDVVVSVEFRARQAIAEALLQGLAPN